MQYLLVHKVSPSPRVQLVIEVVVIAVSLLRPVLVRIKEIRRIAYILDVLVNQRLQVANSSSLIINISVVIKADFFWFSLKGNSLLPPLFELLL